LFFEHSACLAYMMFCANSSLNSALSDFKRENIF
jgi:hypothetical protein